ncbi:MAG TPA: nucleotidyltransferase, partial [Candidatus Portnoybacteria bacterium]|nr:nucleotidyltransferase [Candidatus Portnoybacteria bacterium]
MDQTLKLKIEKFKKAIQTLKDALKQRENEIIKDATIKRFEYCFELGWKTAKV